MFIDEVTVELYAGNGGDGCMAYRREKYIEMGGPFGGNGGAGASIIFQVDEGLNTLIDLRYRRVIKGDKGENGQGSGKHGKKAEDVIVKVPPGTVVTDIATNEVIADLTNHNDTAVIARGGRGGRGNMALATKNNLCPSYAEGGEPGEEMRVKVELKLLADVGLVGLPSVGKSTIISMISAAKPKIAAYHFTTLSPNLGVVRASKGRSYVVADLPGLIEGASLGEGLGDKFLRHIERTRVIAHVIDMGSAEGRNPYEDYLVIRKELGDFNKKILDKPEIIIANKMDMPLAEKNLEEFKTHVNVPVYPIEAISNKGLNEVINKIADMLDTIKKEPLYDPKDIKTHVLYKFREEEPFAILKEKDGFRVVGDKVEKLLKMTKFNTDEAALRFARQLKQMGVDDKLKSMGAQEGDNIRILDLEFEFKD